MRRWLLLAIACLLLLLVLTRLGTAGRPPRSANKAGPNTGRRSVCCVTGKCPCAADDAPAPRKSTASDPSSVPSPPPTQPLVSSPPPTQPSFASPVWTFMSGLSVVLVGAITLAAFLTTPDAHSAADDRRMRVEKSIKDVLRLKEGEDDLKRLEHVRTLVETLGSKAGEHRQRTIDEGLRLLEQLYKTRLSFRPTSEGLERTRQLLKQAKFWAGYDNRVNEMVQELTALRSILQRTIEADPDDVAALQSLQSEAQAKHYFEVVTRVDLLKYQTELRRNPQNLQLMLETNELSTPPPLTMEDVDEQKDGAASGDDAEGGAIAEIMRNNRQQSQIFGNADTQLHTADYDVSFMDLWQLTARALQRRFGISYEQAVHDAGHYLSKRAEQSMENQRHRERLLQKQRKLEAENVRFEAYHQTNVDLAKNALEADVYDQAAFHHMRLLSTLQWTLSLCTAVFSCTVLYCSWKAAFSADDCQKIFSFDADEVGGYLGYIRMTIIDAISTPLCMAWASMEGLLRYVLLFGLLIVFLAVSYIVGTMVGSAVAGLVAVIILQSHVAEMLGRCPALLLPVTGFFLWHMTNKRLVERARVRALQSIDTDPNNVRLPQLARSLEFRAFGLDLHWVTVVFLVMPFLVSATACCAVYVADPDLLRDAVNAIF